MTITVITRPQPQARQLQQVLASAGYVVCEQPLMSFLPGSELAAAAAQLPQLTTQDWLVAVSPRAIDYLHQHLLTQQICWPDCIYLAVGQASANVWRKCHEYEVQTPQSHNAEGMLAHLLLNANSNARIHVLQGDRPRGYLQAQLSQQQRLHASYQCYHRVPQPAVPQVYFRWNSAKKQRFVVTSQELVDILHSGCPVQLRQWLYQCECIVPSQRVADYARTLGFQRLVVSQGAGDQAIFNTIRLSEARETANDKKTTRK